MEENAFCHPYRVIDCFSFLTVMSFKQASVKRLQMTSVLSSHEGMLRAKADICG